jgi:dolichol kinase
MENSSNENRQTLSLKGEFYRKTIHLSSSAVPIGYYFIPEKIVLWIIIPMLVFLLLVEVIKYYNESVYRLYIKYFKFLLREHETDRVKFRINGASWLLIADVLVIIFIPKYIAISGMLLLSLADSLSAIFGRLFGKKQFAPNRTYTGSVTFFVVGVIIVFSTPKYFNIPEEYYLSLIALVFTTISDSIKLPVDDNFAIPVVYSGMLYILYLIFLPAIFV